MTIEWLRDLFIIIFTVIAIGILVFVALMVYSIYNRAKATLDAVVDTTVAVQNISMHVQEQMSSSTPLFQAINVLRGVKEGIDIFSKLFKKQ